MNRLAPAALLLLLGCSGNPAGGGGGGSGGGSQAGGGAATGGGASTGGGGASTGGGGGAATGGGGGSTGGGGGATGGGAGDGGVRLRCGDYCTAVMTNCTGTHQQYLSNDNCLGVCATFPPGTLADTGGDTLGCRIHFALAAGADPASDCTLAGPGGDGVCGQDCQGYCQIVMLVCAPPNLPGTIYSDLADCLSTCGRFRDDAGYNVTDVPLQQSGTTACLLYHAQESVVAPDFHCHQDLSKVDGGNLSRTCNDGPDAGP